MKLKQLLALPIFLSFGVCTGASLTPDSVTVKSEQRFSDIKDGVYFTLSELQHNSPSVTKKNLFRSYYDKSDFTLSQWAATQSLYYVMDDSVKHKVNRDSLWGYVENGTPFIYLNGRFHKFSTIGAISIFTESYPTMQAGMAPVVTDAKTGVFTRLFDMATGEMSDYTLENVSRLLAKDEELYNEFKLLKAKVKKKKVYRFVERFNEKHVLFPAG